MSKIYFEVTHAPQEATSLSEKLNKIGTAFEVVAIVHQPGAVIAYCSMDTPEPKSVSESEKSTPLPELKISKVVSKKKG